MKQTMSWFLATLCLMLGSAAWAEETSPLRLVELTVDEVVAEMNANEAMYTEDSAKLRAMVHERVVPHFNIRRMTQLAMANHWASATPEQRDAISNGMLDLMVRTYTNAMFTFRNTPIRLVNERIMNERSAVVRLSVTSSSSGQPVDVQLRMENRNNAWQVVDVVVGGVSMVITYRGTFADEIRRNGIDGLASSIQKGAIAVPTEELDQ